MTCMRDITCNQKVIRTTDNVIKKCYIIRYICRGKNIKMSAMKLSRIKIIFLSVSITYKSQTSMKKKQSIKIHNIQYKRKSITL